MIPQAFITEWRHAAPWQHPDMIEQDLLISRALVSLFQDTDIRAKLAFRGGTALYKLHVVPATRYSEDIDLVQVTGEPIGPLLDRIHQVLDPWLGMPSYRLKQNSARLVYRFPAESNAQVSLRLKVEINTREHVSYRGLTSRRLRVASTWFTGEAEITTFTLEELLGTKLRALFQRRKGRDLFDLDFCLRHATPDTATILATFVEYMTAEQAVVTATAFRENVLAKCAYPPFCEDVIPLLRDGTAFSAPEAAAHIDEKLLQYLDSAWKRHEAPAPLS